MLNDFHRDNHYLPRMYLKPWETASGRVWTYRILVPHERVEIWKPFSSKSVGHHLHLYTQVGERPPQRGERMLKEHADLVRKFTAEHAWRLIFAGEQDHEVSIFRPRIVNAAAYPRRG